MKRPGRCWLAAEQWSEIRAAPELVVPHGQTKCFVVRANDGEKNLLLERAERNLLACGHAIAP